MAQIQRKQRFEDTLELLDEAGNVCVTLPVSLNLEEIYVKVNSARKAVAKAEKALREDETEDTLKAYGEAVCFLFSVVFGDGGCEEIVRHYSSDYGEMLLDILPYLINDVFPKFDELSSKRLRQAVELRAGGPREHKRLKKPWGHDRIQKALLSLCHPEAGKTLPCHPEERSDEGS